MKALKEKPHVLRSTTSRPTRRGCATVEYREAGYPIGSGTVESACKRLIGARLKGAGMCWSKRGSQGVLTLRAELLSDRWEQSWPRTSLKKVA